MAKGASLGAHPADQFRKQAQRREAKRNKEARDKMREVAVLHKDTTKMERKIEQFRTITRARRMTAAEREKLTAMEDELKEVLQKQKEAGIAPKKRDPSAAAVGFDPLAEVEDRGALVQYSSSGESSSDDGGNGRALHGPELGITVPLDQDMFSATDARMDEANTRTQADSKGGATHEGAASPNALPPMPPGTPPPLPEDGGGLGAIWPPLPSGPSPLYLRANPHRPSATVLAAEPQVRDLRKELTTLVPSAIARRGKHRERQRVLAAVPAMPSIVVNAAPDVAGDGGQASAPGKASASEAILGAVQQVPGVRLSVAPGAASTAPRPDAKRDKGSLDDEYQRFMDQMSKIM
ncbi:hypothetical protein LPJ61_002941 [Coemansia biformis]|uniref:Wbp11/ELF5/Saf1 N-terminal domain-containing protein n=1 Tax=Coemansia biformis TaxID=1286918 RepID=A0A9W7YDI0_9FUNG|nr:hypothetical protein LPJ61_002941 [Coemansia biformis]